MKQRVCIAMGDGGIDDDNPLMDLYILAQTQKRNPKVCLLPTPAGDSPDLIKYFGYVFDRYSCKPSVLSLFRPHTSDITDFVMSQDIIYVPGGHTKSMLGVWYEWGMDKILLQAYNEGVIMTGGSAGSVCWFEQCITDSIPGSLTVMDCLGFLPYSNCPHFFSNARREAYAKFVSSGKIKPGYAADDYAALHFVNEKLRRAVSNRHNAKAYKLSMEDGVLHKKQLKTKWLGVKENREEFIFSYPMFDYLRESVEPKESEETDTSQ